MTPIEHILADKKFGKHSDKMNNALWRNGLSSDRQIISAIRSGAILRMRHFGPKLIGVLCCHYRVRLPSKKKILEQERWRRKRAAETAKGIRQRNKNRRIVVLLRNGGFSFKDIAKLINRSVSSVFLMYKHWNDRLS